MMNRKNATAGLVLGFALAAIATPALARSGAGYDARAQATGAGEVSAQRAQALRECNAVGAQSLQYVWGDTQSDRIRACMAQHGQVE